MSSAAILSSAEAILAAANELRQIRLAVAPLTAPAGKPKKPKKLKKLKTQASGKAAVETARCRLLLPASEYQQLGKLKKQLASRGVTVRKGQLLRAGLMLLATVEVTELKLAIRDVIAPEPLLYKIK